MASFRGSPPPFGAEVGVLWLRVNFFEEGGLLPCWDRVDDPPVAYGRELEVELGREELYEDSARGGGA